VDRITRTCSFALALALWAGAPAAAKKEPASPETDLFWAAQRAEMLGQPDVALKNYNRLLVKAPESAVAVDRLFELAVANGDFPSALKAARAQQLSNGGDAALPLIFLVDAWKRRDWEGAKQSVTWLKEREMFAFLTPIFDAWIDVAQGKQGTISSLALRDSGLLYFYTYDQMIYLDLANGKVDAAQRRLSGFPSFGDEYARHMAMTAAEHFGRTGNADYANSLLAYLGVESVDFVSQPGDFPSDQAIAALFARLSNQLQQQNVPDQSLYFARLANWISPDSVFARMTLADRLANGRHSAGAFGLLDIVTPQHPHWSWVIGEKAQRLNDAGQHAQAMGILQQAQTARPESQNLKLLIARQQELYHQTADAIPIYNELIAAADAAASKNARRVTYRLYLAQVLDKQGNWSEAKATLEQALLLSSDNPDVLNMLGYALLERREDVARGLELVTKAHRLAPQSAAITDSLGWGHYLNGDFEKAIPLLEQAVEGALNDATMNEHLGDAYWRAGRAIDARYAWRSALLNADSAIAARIAAKIDLGWTESTAAP
jgi:Flp pilus assembly protein TadD